MPWLAALVCALALLAVTGCGGGATASSSDACGSATPAQGGNVYPSVPGQPIVASTGGGTSCEKLLQLAKEYAAGHVGTAFFQWLAAQGWTWLNADPATFSRAKFDTDKYDVFVGRAPGEQSQVAFAAS